MRIVRELHSIIGYFPKVQYLLGVVFVLGVDQKDMRLWSARGLAHAVAVVQADVLDKLLYSLILW